MSSRAKLIFGGAIFLILGIWYVTTINIPDGSASTRSDQNTEHGTHLMDEKTLDNFVNERWEAAPETSRDEICVFVKRDGFEETVQLMAWDAGDDSPEFRSAVQRLLLRKCLM